MANYLLRRLWQIIPTLAGVVVLIFVLFRFFGGDPAEILAGQVADAQQIAAIRAQLGLDRPWWVQLGIFAKQVLTLDFGQSWITREPIADILTTRLPATLTVMVPILVLEVILAIPIAMFVAYRRGSLTDRIVVAACVFAMSVSFLVYIIVGQYLFGFLLGWFPVQGWSDHWDVNLLKYAPLPVLLAVLVSLAPQTRLYRTFLLDEIGQDYVRTARAKGLEERAIMFRHVLRNALIPILTNVAFQLPSIFVGSFLIEVFFSIPGLGREVYLAVNRSDYPVIQATTVCLAAFTVLINLLADLLYKVADPRVVLK